MKRKMICYFESEAQCEAATDALIKSGIDKDEIRIVTDSTQDTDTSRAQSKTVIGSAAPLAMPDGYITTDTASETTYAQAPVATLLIRGDLFTFSEKDASDIGSYAVEVNADAQTLDLARDILLNLF